MSMISHDYDVSFWLKLDRTKEEWKLTTVFNGDTSISDSVVQLDGLKDQFEVTEAVQGMLERLFGEETQ